MLKKNKKIKSDLSKKHIHDKNEIAADNRKTITGSQEWEFIGAFVANEFEKKIGINEDAIEWTDEIVFLKDPLYNEIHKCMIFKTNASIYASCEVSMNLYIYFSCAGLKL